MPVFSISVCAYDVDGHSVTTAWYIDDVQDIAEFDNTIITSISSANFSIATNVVFDKSIEKNNVWDFEIEFIGSTASYNEAQVYFFNDSNLVISTYNVSIEDNKLSFIDLQFNDVCSRVLIYFNISSPFWRVISTVYDFTIDGTTYQYEKGMSWNTWVSSSYNTLGVTIDSESSQLVLGDALDFKVLKNGDDYVYGADYIDSSITYVFVNPSSAPTYATFIGDGYEITFQVGMTWKDWIDSSMNTYGWSYSGDYVYNSDGNKVWERHYNSNMNAWMTSGIQPDLLIEANCIYGSEAYCDGYPYNYLTAQYEFDFSISSVSVTLQDDSGLLKGIIGWVKNIFNAIKELPSKIVNGITDAIKSLFIPSEQSFTEIKDKFEALLADRFGAAYDAVDIIDDFTNSFVYTDTQALVSFPSVTVNLAGTQFTFGGWEISVIPQGFQGLVDTLKLVINIVCTVAFVMACKKRYEGVFR